VGCVPRRVRGNADRGATTVSLQGKRRAVNPSFGGGARKWKVRRGDPVAADKKSKVRGAEKSPKALRENTKKGGYS